MMFAGFALFVLVIKLAVQGEIPGASDIDFNLLSFARNYAAYRAWFHPRLRPS